MQGLTAFCRPFIHFYYAPNSLTFFNKRKIHINPQEPLSVQDSSPLKYTQPVWALPILPAHTQAYTTVQPDPEGKYSFSFYEFYSIARLEFSNILAFVISPHPIYAYKSMNSKYLKSNTCHLSFLRIPRGSFLCCPASIWRK